MTRKKFEPISRPMQKLLDEVWDSPAAKALQQAMLRQVLAGAPSKGEDFDDRMVAAQQATEDAVDQMVLTAIAMHKKRTRRAA